MEVSRHINKDLEVRDERIQTVVNELDQDNILVTKGHEYVPPPPFPVAAGLRKSFPNTVTACLSSYVVKCWDQIDAECEGRYEDILQFAQRLEKIELDRASIVGGELHGLVERLVAIAYKSPAEIERYIESEAFDLNSVLLVNKESHGEILSLIKKQHVLVCMNQRIHWETREADWRQLRHDRAVQEFHDELESKKFTNPPARVKLLDQCMQNQVGLAQHALLRICPSITPMSLLRQKFRHEERESKLHQLLGEKLPTSVSANRVLEDLKGIAKRDDNALNELTQALAELRDEQVRLFVSSCVPACAESGAGCLRLAVDEARGESARGLAGRTPCVRGFGVRARPRCPR